MNKSISKNNSENDIEEVKNAIALLETLVTDTDKIFEIPKDLRIALIKLAGQLSRPSREEFSRRTKYSNTAAKRKQAAKDKHARNDTGNRHARKNPTVS